MAILLALWSIIPILLDHESGLRDKAQGLAPFLRILFPTPSLTNFLTVFGLSTGGVNYGSLSGLGTIPQFLAALPNSIVVATSVMVLTVILCVPAGYAFARFSFPARTRYSSRYFLALAARRNYRDSLYQLYEQLGLLGTVPGLILVDMTLTVPLTTWVLSGYFGSLPMDINRQARIDGCNRWNLFTKVLIPIAAPGIAAVAVLAWLTSWNEFVLALLLAYSNGLYTVAPALAAPLFGSGADVNLYTAQVTIATIPAIIAAIFLQRYMTRLRIVDPLTFGERR